MLVTSRAQQDEGPKPEGKAGFRNIREALGGSARLSEQPAQEGTVATWANCILPTDDSKNAELFKLYLASKVSIKKTDVQNGTGRMNAG